MPGSPAPPTGLRAGPISGAPEKSAGSTLDPGSGRDPVEDWRVIKGELAAYSSQLAGRPQIVAGSKAELPGTESRRRALEAFCEAEGLSFHAISSVTGLGLPGLLRDIAGILASHIWAPAAG